VFELTGVSFEAT